MDVELTYDDKLLLSFYLHGITRRQAKVLLKKRRYSYKEGDALIDMMKQDKFLQGITGPSKEGGQEELLWSVAVARCHEKTRRH